MVAYRDIQTGTLYIGQYRGDVTQALEADGIAENEQDPSAFVECGPEEVIRVREVYENPEVIGF